MPNQQLATFAAGCFWGVEHQFRQLPGIIDTTVGFMGGQTSHPSYEQVCQHHTGHAEVVHVVWNPEEISYLDLLATFWNIHDPTLLNRQGPDVGSQYRSAIFYHNQTQNQQALSSKQSLESSKHFADPIVTQITPASTFYPADEFHQRYVEKHGGGHCQTGF